MGKAKVSQKSVGLYLNTYGSIPCIDVQNLNDYDQKCFVEAWPDIKKDFTSLRDRYLGEIAYSICKSTVATMQRDPHILSILLSGDKALRCFFDDEDHLIRAVHKGDPPQSDICELSDIANWATNSDIRCIKNDMKFIFVLVGLRINKSDKYSMFLAFPKCPRKMFGDNVKATKCIPSLQLTKCQNLDCRNFAAQKCWECGYLRCCRDCWNRKNFKGHGYTVCPAICEMMKNP